MSSSTFGLSVNRNSFSVFCNVCMLGWFLMNCAGLAIIVLE